MKTTSILNNKKAMVFNVMVVIFTIVVLTYAFVRLSDKMDTGKEIGEAQMEVILDIQDGEKALIFLDFASKMALYQAVYDLQAQGGVSETETCGTYYGFNRWNSDSGDTCFVDASTAKDSLRDIFVSHLVARVAAYPSADFVGNLPESALTRGASMLSESAAAAPGSAPLGPGATAVSFEGQTLTAAQKDTLLASLAQEYDYEFPVLKAFLAVESGSRGFRDGLMVIRMEAHVFNRKCNSDKGTWEPTRRHNRAINGVSCEGGQVNEHACLRAALALDPECGYEAISMGLPQIMGFNSRHIGYDSARAMFDDFNRGEEIQIRKFIEFISNGEELSTAIKEKDWDTMARIYNGDRTGLYSGRLQENYDPDARPPTTTIA